MGSPQIDVWFNSWARLSAIGVGSVFFFVFAIMLMRALGKRTTAQMNNFDWIITVAIGSLASSGILLKDVSISDAAIAILVLGVCQWSTTWLVIQAPWLSRLIKPTPRLLVHRGELLTPALRKERISTDELYGRLREHGFVDLDRVMAVVLETDGRMTVIPTGEENISLGQAKLLGNVAGIEGLETSQEEDRIEGTEERA